MKVEAAKSKIFKKPFFKDDKLELVVSVNSDNEIVSVEATHLKVTKVFPVKKLKVLEAWKQLEAWLEPKLK